MLRMDPFEYRHRTSSSVVGSVAIYIYVFRLNHKIGFLSLTSLLALAHTHTHRVFQTFIYSIIVTELIRRGEKRTNEQEKHKYNLSVA